MGSNIAMSCWSDVLTVSNCAAAIAGTCGNCVVPIGGLCGNWVVAKGCLCSSCVVVINDLCGAIPNGGGFWGWTRRRNQRSVLLIMWRDTGRRATIPLDIELCPP